MERVVQTRQATHYYLVIYLYNIHILYIYIYKYANIYIYLLALREEVKTPPFNTSQHAFDKRKVNPPLNV